MDPSRYAQQKAAANAAYHRWAGANAFTSPFAPLTVTVLLNKPGMNANTNPPLNGGSETTPPDTTGAISPNYYVEFVNEAITVYNRSTLAAVSGGTTGTATFTKNADGQSCDVQIKWDNVARRFLYVILDCGSVTSGDGIYFGWSKTSSPLPLTGATANWCQYHLSTGTNLEDYPKLGQDNGFMIIGANEFPGGGSYTDSPVFAIPLPANGSTTCPSTATATKFVPTNEFTPEPANIFNSSTTGYVVAINFSQNGLRMFSITGSPTPVLHDLGTVTVPAFSMPASVPQPSPATPGDVIDTLDTRLTQANAATDPSANVKALAVWTQHTIAGPSGGPSVVRWYELKPGTTSATLVQDGTISDTGLFAFNGAIAPTSVGNAAAIDYNTGSSSTRVTLRAQARAAGAAAGTMGNETTLATSTEVDDDFSCPSFTGGTRPCRWGDYAAASTDPNGCGSAVWGSNQLNSAPPAGPGAAVWSTQNFEVLADECPTAAFTFSAGSGNTENYNGSGSSDADGKIVKWVWSFGDKTTLTTTVPTTTHTYAAKGTYTVTLTVTDSAGLTATVTHSVPVA